MDLIDSVRALVLRWWRSPSPGDLIVRRFVRAQPPSLDRDSYCRDARSGSHD